MNNKPDRESMVRERLAELKPVPRRDPTAAARTRALFLSQAVSAGELQRQKGWKPIFRKEHFAMNLLLSMLLIAGLFFGGGATVNAAQDDLPDQPLYAVKIWSEDISLQLQNGPQAKTERLMELAQIRIEEMKRLIGSGQTPPDQLRVRLENHIQQALQLCSTMEDPALDRTLAQLRDQLQQQDREMERLQIHAPGDAQPILSQTRAMLQKRLQLVDEGLVSPEMFRDTVRNGFNYGKMETSPTAMPSVASTPGGQPNGQATPQVGPGNGAGPGPGNGPGDQNPGLTPMPKYDGSGQNQNGSPAKDKGGNGSGGSGSGGTGTGGNGSGGGSAGGSGPGSNRP